MSDSKITVSLQRKELRLSLSSGTIHTFPVAIGKPETPTPKTKKFCRTRKYSAHTGLVFLFRAMVFTAQTSHHLLEKLYPADAFECTTEISNMYLNMLLLVHL